MNEAEQLREDNERLKARVIELERKLAFWEGHTTLGYGARGEQLVAAITGGQLTHHTELFDLEMSNGARVEVKYSKANVSVKGSPGRRWQWNKIYGQAGGKKYDYLLLIGEKDERHWKDYRDSDAPYVLFLLKRGDERPFVSSGGNYISVGANPLPKTVRYRALFERHQISADALSEALQRDD
ncbi:MAG: hypothetical protein TEF_21320 [Rhizobiales bacterium NRL2]|jgi:hypothetical protein|nr:MAG: hypothetical protein TEF_21320 [Rhizobiales bacterium NRL2]